MENERYNIIVNCSLKGPYCTYLDSYVLIKDINDLENELNVDLKGLCFNTDCQIKDIEKVEEIKSLDELYDFCKNKDIWINPKNITKLGLLVGADSSYLILKDMKPYGWISENYIENDVEKEEILNNIEKEIEENIEEESM